MQRDCYFVDLHYSKIENIITQSVSREKMASSGVKSVETIHCVILQSIDSDLCCKTFWKTDYKQLFNVIVRLTALLRQLLCYSLTRYACRCIAIHSLTITHVALWTNEAIPRVRAKVINRYTNW